MSLARAPRLRPRRVPFATRTLLHDWLRLVISVGGIGVAILLVLLLQGIMDGTVAKSTTYIDHVGADVVVARGGVTNMTLSASVLPVAAVDTIGGIEGVETSAGILRAPAIITRDDAKRPVTLIGYDVARRLGGPWKLHSGRGVETDGEAVLDRVLADSLGAGIGDAVTISGQPFEVVGVSLETAAIAGKHVFVSQQAAQGLLAAPGIVNFVLVALAPGEDAEAAVARINATSDEVTAQSRERLSKNDREVLSDLFVAPINVMSTVGFLIGLAVIGLTMYTTTAERLRDFGVLKAIGASNPFLFRTVMTQAVVLGLAGFVAGLAASQAVGPLIVRLVPDIGVTVKAAPALRTLGFVMAMSVAGAILPVARIMRVDPLLVFRR